MVYIFTKDNGFCEWIGCVKEFHNPVCNELCSLVQDEYAIHILLIVGAAFDFLPKVIFHAGRWCPAVDVFVDIDADHFIGR